MTIKELIYNAEFNFNVDFRIIAYDFDADEGTVMYDSIRDSSCPQELLTKDIIAVNQDVDSVVEIEYARN